MLDRAQELEKSSAMLFQLPSYLQNAWIVHKCGPV